MREITFKQIIDACVRATGWEVGSVEVQTKLPIFAELINDWVQQAMDHEFWPDTMRLEQRAFEETFSVSVLNPPTEITVDDDSGIESIFPIASACPVGSILQSGRSYFMSSLAEIYFDGSTNEWRLIPKGNNVDSSDYYWAPDNGCMYPDLDTFIANVDLISSISPAPTLTYTADTNEVPETYIDKGNPWDLDPIGKVDLRACLFEDRPELRELNNAYRRVGEANGKLLCSDASAPDGTIWVYYQILPPQFSATAYSSATSYSKGDVRYDATTQHCYMSRIDGNLGNAVTNATYWKKQPFPAFLRNAVKWGVASEFLSEEEGKYKTEAKATRELNRLQYSILQGSGNGYKAKRRN